MGNAARRARDLSACSIPGAMPWTCCPHICAGVTFVRSREAAFLQRRLSRRSRLRLLAAALSLWRCIQVRLLPEIPICTPSKR
eukprot:970589-Amphidinium_carterae.1